MSKRVNLPPGCSGFTCSDGTKYSGKPGGHVNVAERHARDIAHNPQLGGNGGLVSLSTALTIGTKKGRWCMNCGRLWQAWSYMCPRCGEETVPDSE
jgi:hypothetical protein